MYLVYISSSSNLADFSTLISRAPPSLRAMLGNQVPSSFFKPRKRRGHAGPRIHAYHVPKRTIYPFSQSHSLTDFVTLISGVFPSPQTMLGNQESLGLFQHRQMSGRAETLISVAIPRHGLCQEIKNLRVF